MSEQPLPLPSDESTPAEIEPRRTGSRLGWWAGAAVVVIITAVWAIALLGDFDVPGRLENTAFPVTAEPICQSTRSRIDGLPKAFETPNPVDRAVVVDRASDELDRMLADLAARAPTSEPEKSPVSQWLADWRTYVENRRDYARRLRVDNTARLYVAQSDRDKKQVTAAMDRFANVNNMSSCRVPEDVS